MTEEPVEIPIEGQLDLHTFQPKDVADLVEEYLNCCRRQGILEIRIIHGKGVGTLRELVHGVLRRRSDVVDFEIARDGSGWGATMVLLADDD